MEQDKAINIQLPDGFTGERFQVEIVHTQGQDPMPINPPIKYGKVVSLTAICGMVDAGKYAQFATPKENPGIVTFCKDPDNLFIFIEDDPTNELATTLYAKLEINPKLKDWGINTGKTFSVPVLEKFVLAHVNDFAEPGKVGALRKSLQNMEIKFESEYKKEDDRQGNKSEVRKTALKIIEGAFKDIFTWDLNLPLFKGQPPVAFTVDLEIDENNGHPIVSFYCLQLELLMKDNGEALVQNQIDKLATTFVCLEQTA